MDLALAATRKKRGESELWWLERGNRISRKLINWIMKNAVSVESMNDGTNRESALKQVESPHREEQHAARKED